MLRETRKVFSVWINDKEYEVYDIPGKEHLGLNDTIKTWWVYYGDKSELPKGVIPPLDSNEWAPYSDVSLLRVCWDIRIKERNTAKFKWNETDFRHSTYCEMFANGKCVFAFSARRAEWALTKARYLQVVLMEHVYNFLEPEKENGRKIYVYGLPAIVIPSSVPGEISIKPEYVNISKSDWWKEYRIRQTPENIEFVGVTRENISDYAGSDIINWGSALYDGNIGWFRKENDVKL